MAQQITSFEKTPDFAGLNTAFIQLRNKPFAFFLGALYDKFKEWKSRGIPLRSHGVIEHPNRLCKRILSAFINLLLCTTVTENDLREWKADENPLLVFRLWRNLFASNEVNTGAAVARVSRCGITRLAYNQKYQDFLGKFAKPVKGALFYKASTNGGLVRFRAAKEEFSL
jgi:hypothetical protein